MAQQHYSDIAHFRQQAGKELPPGEWITVTQVMIQSFADATLDQQWIHVDADRARRESPFGAPVAHGFLSVSLLSKMIEELVAVEGVRMGVNYGLNRVRFPQAVQVDARLRLRCRVGKVEAYGEHGVKVFWDFVIEIAGKEKPACVGELISLMFE